MTMNTNVGRFRGALSVVLVLLSLLLSAWSVQARAEIAANVHFASGYVAATAQGAGARQLAKGDDIFSGDRVDTADNGRVQMRFTDGGLVSLMPNTTFSVDEYLHEGKAEDDASLVFGLLKGGLRTVTGTIGKVQHDQYELKTPVATLGIRGTEYVAVLRPANTLRVHVGRGKVVITNDQGSLEVPEGYNAVVTLGSAPEFSEQGPQYQATGPMGDRLIATNQHHQDPHLLNPRANMPELGLSDFDGITNDVITSLPPGTYQMAAMFPPSSGGPTPFYSDSIELDFDSSGHLISLEPADLDMGDWQSFNVVTSGSLSWGEFADGNVGSINGDPISLNPDQYASYVVGSAPITMPTSGQLNYSLDGATPARAFNTAGALVDVGTLNLFTFNIDLDSTPTYDLTMRVTMDNQGVYQGTTTGQTLTVSGSSFSFSNSMLTGGNCSSGCNLSVDGFIAGSNAGQAGVVYVIDDAGNRITGAAGLSAAGLGN